MRQAAGSARLRSAMCHAVAGTVNDDPHSMHWQTF